MPPARYMHLTPVETGTLEHVYRQTEKADLRTRCRVALEASASQSNT